MRGNGLTNSPTPGGATIDTGGTTDVVTLGSGLTLTGSVLSSTGGGGPADYFILDGGTASTTYSSNSFKIDFGAAT